jgi:ribonuclease E
MPEPAFAADALDEPAHPEAELTHAVADLDAAPPADFVQPAGEPVEAAAPAPPPPSAEPEPRRRSTVREPAPIGGSSIDTPPPAAPPPAVPTPEPVITEVDETVSAKQPRRSGWWSRRFAGG